MKNTFLEGVSPEVTSQTSSFLIERLREIAAEDTNEELDIEQIDFSRNATWKAGKHYDYLEPIVKKELQTREKIGAQCSFQIDSQEITVFIVYILPKEFKSADVSAEKQMRYYHSILHKIYLWLRIANKYRGETCSEQLSIYLYLTDLPKLLDNSRILGRKHVNTGFSIACSPKNEIYVFREEEWFKVFIHETFHALGMDFSESRLSHIQEMCQEKIYEVFDIPHVNILVYEAYTELWAEIMNLLFVVYFSPGKNPNLNKMLHYEIEFSSFQCAKVLAHYSMKYTDLFSQSPGSVQKRRDYREDSNVIAYYVIKTLLYNHLDAFIQWNIGRNGGSFKFLANAENTAAFCGDLIGTYYNNPVYINKLNMYSDWLHTHMRENTIETKTLRMTIYE